LSLNLVVGRDKLLELGGSSFKSWARDVGHEDVGSLFGEEDTCFETDASA